MVNSPYKRGNVIRVSSPFTVESQSPYRYIPSHGTEETQTDESLSLDQNSAIISTLEKTGVSGRKLEENQKIRFKEVTDWVQDTNADWSKGNITLSPITHTAWALLPQKDGEEIPKEVRAVIAIAPDDLTVSSAFVNRAAKDAAQLADTGFLVVIAFAFEAGLRAADIEVRGKLQILKVQANRDLQVGNLHDEKSDHAFVMIGEPDVLVSEAGPGLISVEVLGFDTYDPATGNVEPGSPAEIDCWMIDTNYDGISFFARRIHFPNPGDRQITRLKRKLATRLDQNAWDAMLSHKSTPFRRPNTGNIAVKIVTTTHTEMVTVIEV